MPTVKITDRAIRSMKVTGEKRVEMWEKGFGVRASPEGSKVFLLRYSAPDGSRPKLTLGYYVPRSVYDYGPVSDDEQEEESKNRFVANKIEPGNVPLTLAEARAVAKVQRGLIASGRDPAREKQIRRAKSKEAKRHKVESLADDFIEEQKRQGVKTWFEQRRQLKKDVLPTLKDLPVSGVTPQDVRSIVDRIVKRGKKRGLSHGGAVQANRTRSLLVQVFNYALTDPDWRDLLQGNPALAVPKALKSEPPRDRQLSDEEMKRLWNAAEPLEPVIRGAFRLRLMTAQRWEEIRGMRWSELRKEHVEIGPLRGDVLVWDLPASRTKAKREQVLPLPHRIENLIEELRPLTGESDYVFESPRKPNVPISRVNRSFRKWKSDAKVEDFIGLDIRRAVATAMSRLGVRDEVVEAILNHRPRTITRQVYNKYDLLPEKRQALEKWAGHLDRIVKGKKPAKVIEMKRRQG